MLFPGLPVLLAAAVLLVLATCPSSISADDTGTNFFLKASKSVPRIGRRSEYDIYLKTPKNVPRIGRRREMSPLVSKKSVVYRWRQQRCAYLVLGGWCWAFWGDLAACQVGGYWAPRDEVAEKGVMDCDLESGPWKPKQERRKKG